MDREQGDNPDLNGEAHKIADMLDSGKIEPDAVHESIATKVLEEDLSKMQRDPGRQQALLQKINELDHKGTGADLQIQRGTDGRELWRIVGDGSTRMHEVPGGPPRYGAQFAGREYPQYPQQQFRDQPRAAGSEFINTMAIGIGVSIGNALLSRGLGGRADYYEQRQHEFRPYYQRHQPDRH